MIRVCVLSMVMVLGWEGIAGAQAPQPKKEEPEKIQAPKTGPVVAVEACAQEQRGGIFSRFRERERERFVLVHRSRDGGILHNVFGHFRGGLLRRCR